MRAERDQEKKRYETGGRAVEEEEGGEDRGGEEVRSTKTNDRWQGER